MIAFIKNKTLYVVPENCNEEFALEQFLLNDDTERAGPIVLAFDKRPLDYDIDYRFESSHLSNKVKAPNQ